MGTASLPYTLTPGATENVAHVQSNDEALRDAINSNYPLADAGLVSANNSVYKTIHRGEVVLASDQVAGTYALRASGADTDASPVLVFSSTPSGLNAVYLDDADYAVSGLTAKLRVRAQVSTNGTVPAITFTAGLYPVTFSGAADVLTATLGTVVASSTVAIASPSADTTTSGASSNVNIPSDGLYVLGVVTSATLTNNAACLVTAQLQTRNV